MAVMSFIEKRDQAYVIERILKHCGLWDRPASRAPPQATGPPVQPVLDLQYVDEDEFLMALLYTLGANPSSHPHSAFLPLFSGNCQGFLRPVPTGVAPPPGRDRQPNPAKFAIPFDVIPKPDYT